MNNCCHCTRECPSSPTGKHCMHFKSGPYWSTVPPQPICCYCGKSEAEMHGPYYPNYPTQNAYPYTITTTWNTSDGTTWYTTGQYGQYTSGYVTTTTQADIQNTSCNVAGCTLCNKDK